MKDNKLVVVIVALLIGLAIGWYFAGNNSSAPAPTAYNPGSQQVRQNIPSSFLQGAIGGVCTSNADCGLYEVCENSGCADATDLVTPREIRMGAMSLPIPAAEYNQMLASDGFVKVVCPDGQNGIEFIMAHPFKDPCFTIQ